MTTSFSTSAGIFCISWQHEKKKGSVWVQSIRKAINLTFAMKVKKIELWYFSPSGEVKKIYRRKS